MKCIRFQRNDLIVHASLYRHYFCGVELDPTPYWSLKIGVWPLCVMIQGSKSAMNRQVNLNGWMWY